MGLVWECRNRPAPWFAPCGDGIGDKGTQRPTIRPVRVGIGALLHVSLKFHLKFAPRRYGIGDYLQGVLDRSLLKGMGLVFL